MNKYWAQDHLEHPYAKLALRAVIAKELIERVGICTGTDDGEDSAGRTRYKLLPPAQLIERAFAVADAFVDMAELRGEIQAVTADDTEASCRRAGELERVRNEATYPRKMPV